MCYAYIWVVETDLCFIWRLAADRFWSDCGDYWREWSITQKPQFDKPTLLLPLILLWQTSDFCRCWSTFCRADDGAITPKLVRRWSQSKVKVVSITQMMRNTSSFLAICILQMDSISSEFFTCFIVFYLEFSTNCL